MAYGDINQWANVENIEDLWTQIVNNFIHAAPASVGDIMYWATASEGGVGHTPVQPAHRSIGSVTGKMLTVVNAGTSQSPVLVPDWTTPQILQSGGTGANSALQLYISGTENISPSVKLSLQVAGASAWGIVTDQAQTFGGEKTFNESIKGKKNIEAEWGVSAEGIADLGLSAGGGGGTVTAIEYGDVPLTTRYTPTSGIITLPKSADNITWTTNNQSLTSDQKTQLLALYAKAPAALWDDDNEIADKGFVNSSIATATATFKGTVTAAGDTEAQAQTALASITGMDANDYAFVKVENTPQTGVDKFKRYKYTGSAWSYEYTLNNSSFTSDQWAAINSGITSSLVTDIGTLKGCFNMSTGKALKAVEADKLSSARTIALTGNVTGSASATGENGWSISTTIADSAVTTAKLNDGAVTTAKIKDGDVTNAKLANSTIYVNGTTLTLGDSSTDNVLTEKWGKSRGIKIASSDGSNESSAVSVDGSGAVTLKLASTIKADLAGNATSADKLTVVSKTAWGQTYWTSGGVPDSISGNMTNVGDISFSGTGKTIGGFVKFDTTNSRLGINLGNNSLTDTLFVGGTFKTTGNSVIGGTLTIAGATTLQDTLTVSGNTTIGGTLNVSEDITGSKNIQAHCGVSAQGICDLSLGSGGGGGTIIGVYVNGQTYTSVNAGILTLPDYPTAEDMIEDGLASEEWVQQQITNLSLGTASTHAHGDYVTAITYDSTNRKLQQSKGGGTATDIVQFGTNAFNSTAYLPLSGGILTNNSKTILTLKSSAVTPEETCIRYSFGDTVKAYTGYSTTDGVYMYNAARAKSLCYKDDGSLLFEGGKVWHASNDGSGSGLDADLLDGTHKADLFTAFTNDNDQLSSTIGGTNKKVTVGYASRSTDTKTELLTEQEFIYRQTAGGALTYKPSSAVLKRVLGNSVVWNQRIRDYDDYAAGSIGCTNCSVSYSNGIATITGNAGNSNFTLTRNGANAVIGHRYYHRIVYKSTIGVAVYESGGSGSFGGPGKSDTFITYTGLSTNNYATGTTGFGFYISNATAAWEFQLKMAISIDLTLFFNGNIPTGLTAATFERDYGYLLTNPAYNAGQLINNSAKGLETVGFNIWDEEWESGNIDNSTGTPVYATGRWRSKNYIPVVGGETYYFYVPSGMNVNLFAYDVNENYIATYNNGWVSGSSSSSNVSSLSIAMPQNCAYIKIKYGSTDQSSYQYNVTINLSDPTKNGTYEPYKKTITDLNLREIKVKSPNIWDEEYLKGTYSSSDGVTFNASDTFICSKNFIDVIEGETYYFKGNAAPRIFYYNKDGVFDTSVTINNNVTFTIPRGISKIKWQSGYPAGAYNNDCVINKADSGFNGKYFPHGVLTFNGLKQAGNVRDEKIGNKLIRRVYTKHLYGLSWNHRTTPVDCFYANLTPNSIVTNSVKNNNTCSRYVTFVGNWAQATNKTCFIGPEMITSGVSTVAIVDSAYSSYSTSDFNNAMNGVYLNYELAIPEVYEIIDEAPYEYPIDVLGTERIVSDELVAPFVADIQYGAEQRDFALDINSVFTGLTSRIDAMDISHYQSGQTSPIDSHLITINGKKFYVRFSAVNGSGSSSGSLPSFELAMADNPNGENEQVFSFGTISTEWIQEHCVLPGSNS